MSGDGTGDTAIDTTGVDGIVESDVLVNHRYWSVIDKRDSEGN